MDIEVGCSERIDKIRMPKKYEAKSRTNYFQATIHFLANKLGELKNTYVSWQEQLSLQKDVYLLTFSDGQQYVGSATGSGGFWQRWQDYLKNGHGGNAALKDRDSFRSSLHS